MSLRKFREWLKAVGKKLAEGSSGAVHARSPWLIDRDGRVHLPQRRVVLRASKHS